MGDKIRIKLCGLRRPEDIGYVNAVQPDFAGFILAQGKRRTVTPEQLGALSRGLNPDIARVAVFLDQDPEWIAQVVRDAHIDWIQLHGSEDADTIRLLQEMSGKPVIKAFRIDGPEDVRAAQHSPADLVLLDHGTGGTGESFDWSLVAALERPFLLAGGLGPGNVEQAIRSTRPWGVDVSSGVETDGVKDEGKIEAFVKTVRAL